MAKHEWQICDWIIFHNDGEHGKTIDCCAVGSEKATKAKGTVLRSFYGTYPECKRLVDDLNSATSNKFLRHYVRKEKNLDFN